MPGPALTLDFATREATMAFARRLAGRLRRGDVVLLEGDLGAGKSEIARAIIRARMGAEVEVPSPTFTLVQRYAAPDLVLTHADLYRLSGPDEIAELGLDEAIDEGVLLVEWPQRADCGFFAATALRLRITAGEGEARRLELEGDAAWPERLAGLGPGC